MKTGLFLTLLIGILGIVQLQGCKTSPATPSMTDIPDSSLVKLGTEITDEAFKVLSGHLGQAMGEGGVPNALSYCNEKAIPLTDSLSTKHQVTLRRTALRTRNENNNPSAQEENILKDFEKRASSDGMEKFAPEIRREESGEVNFYRPIFALGKCMACHGTPGLELDTTHIAQIRSLYPQDRATNFEPGDLRGMWVVEFADPEAVAKMLADSLR